MRLFYLLLISLLIFSCRTVPVQPSYSSNDVLLTIDDKDVTVSEFLYSFRKSHQNEDSLKTADIDDYLQLFINYKLKVSEARKAGYDTMKTYLNELELYQEQLKSSYRTSDKIVDSLKAEAYERLGEEVKVSHILIRLPEKPQPEDTLRAYMKITSLRKEASSKDFNTVAYEFSEDPSARSNRGNLGYFTAFQMIYPFETAAYNTPVGSISGPVRTVYGYHILKVHDKRKVKGNYKLHQLQLKEINQQDSLEASNIIFELREMLKNGLSGEQALESVDKNKFNARFIALPSLSLSQMPSEIQEVVMGMTQKGEVSDPVRSESGWHILILDEIEPFPSFSSMEPRLDKMVRRTDRLELYNDIIQSQLLEKHGYTPQMDIIKAKNLTGQGNPHQVIFILGGNSYHLDDFHNYLLKNNVDTSSTRDVEKAYNSFLGKQVMAIEDAEMIRENEELKWLLKEYEEGMLLFNIMEDSVWNKAVTDTLGLRMYQEEISAAVEKNESSINTGGRMITNYQQYLEDKWMARLRKEREIIIDDKVLDYIYQQVINGNNSN